MVRGGRGVPNGHDLRSLFAAPGVVVRLDLRSGRGRAVLWTCDLTRRYVDINAHYTT